MKKIPTAIQTPEIIPSQTEYINEQDKISYI